MQEEHSSRRSPVQVDLATTNNGSYPHEDTTTVTGSGGNGSGAPRMRIGREADRTWVAGGEQISLDILSFQKVVSLPHLK